MSREGPPLPPEAFLPLLAAAAATYRIPLGDEALDRLGRYLSELDRARRGTNLTGRLGPEALADHVLESAFGARLVPPGAALLDIGSGAGFPGIPIAALRPDAKVTLLEPRRRRADFLREAAAAVPLENVTVIEGRPAALAGRSYDGATSRAVGGLDRVLGEAAFLRPGAIFLAWTTEPQALARSLAAVFALEGAEPVPGSRRKTIARFRKRA